MDDGIDKVANLTHGNLFIQEGFRCDVKRLIKARSKRRSTHVANQT